MLVRRIARPLLGSIFITGGISSLRDPGPRAAAAEKLGIHQKLGQDPVTLVKINGAAHLVGGLALATGRVPRLAALGLAVSLLPTTAAGHAFWRETEPASKAAQQIHFTKNLSILGGLLLASVDTEAKDSVTRRAKRVSKRAAHRAAEGAGHVLP